MTTTTQLRITRTPLPPAIVPDDETMWGRHDTYAEVSSGRTHRRGAALRLLERPRRVPGPGADV